MPGKLIRNIFGVSLGGTDPQGQAVLLRQLRRGAAGRERAGETDCADRDLSAGRDSLSRRYGERSRQLRKMLSAAQITQLDSACGICNSQAYSFRSGTEPERAGLFQFDARGQWADAGRRRLLTRFVLVFLASSDPAQHDNRQNRLRAFSASPALCPRHICRRTSPTTRSSFPPGSAKTFLKTTARASPGAIRGRSPLTW